MGRSWRGLSTSQPFQFLIPPSLIGTGSFLRSGPQAITNPSRLRGANPRLFRPPTGVVFLLRQVRIKHNMAA